jgi:NADH-quinone oxidoreductase subunit L
LHESPAAMTIPLIVLAVLSVVGGLIGIPEILGGNHQLHHFLAPVLTTEQHHEIPHTTEFILMGVSVALAAIAIAFAISKYSKKPELNDADGFGKVLANKWYIDELYDAIIVKPINAIAVFFKNIIEKSGIDGVVNGVGKFVSYGSRQLRLLQSGQVNGYVLMMVLAMVVMLLIWLQEGMILRTFIKLFN